jgi:mycoredoxin
MQQEPPSEPANHVPGLKNNNMSGEITVYGHPTCPGLGPVKGLLAQSKVKFEYVNIHQDSAAAARVRSINNGNESVPTLVFPDGSTLTEPSVGELKAKLESLGYSVGSVAWLIGNSWRIFIAVAILIAVLRFLGFF